MNEEVVYETDLLCTTPATTCPIFTLIEFIELSTKLLCMKV